MLGVSLPHSPYSPLGHGHARGFIKNASMKIARQNNSESQLDTARVALFLNVFVRLPMAPRRRNIRGR